MNDPNIIECTEEVILLPLSFDDILKSMSLFTYPDSKQIFVVGKSKKDKNPMNNETPKAEQKVILSKGKRPHTASSSNTEPALLNFSSPELSYRVGKVTKKKREVVLNLTKALPIIDKPVFLFVSDLS